MAERKKVVVLGAGSWGTALSHHLARIGHDTTLWGRDAAVLEAIRTEHKNPKYFPDLSLEPAIKTEGDILRAVQPAEAVIIAVP